MKKIIFFLHLLLCSILINAQTSISGFINLNKTEKSISKISLYKVEVNQDNKQEISNLLATAPIGKNGFFQFDKNVIETQDQIYKVELEWERDAPIDVIDYQYFILSKTDSIYFHRSNQLIGNYSNTNIADLEWQKLNQFQSQFNSESGISQQNNYKNYLKDSLQILLVKLIGIKQLDDKMLLEKDIFENQSYYVDLLDELKNSDLDPIEYAHLENKIALFNLKNMEQKYHYSLLWNILAILVIGGLLGYLFYLRKKINTTTSIPTPQLSKQEQVIKDLILEGKSNKEIANQLYISISTVKSHITNLYKKLGVSSRNDILMNS